MGVSVVIVLILVRARIPNKVLLFDDRLLIKYRTCRSVEIPLDELEASRLEGFRRV